MLKGRPRKKKIIQAEPRTDVFAPKNRPGDLDVIILPVEEYEAIRLHDLLLHDQKFSAGMMGISQQSFSRLIRKARGKISDALVNAKIIKIEGGDFINKRSADIATKLRRSFCGSGVKS